MPNNKINFHRMAEISKIVYIKDYFLQLVFHLFRQSTIYSSHNWVSIIFTVKLFQSKIYLIIRKL